MGTDRSGTTPTPASPHVVIVGGGIGGLCLAQGLKQAGISVALYERDASADLRGQGYRIHINPHGSHALLSCLPENLFDLYVATSNRPATTPGNAVMAVFDQQLHQRFAKPLPAGPPDTARVVSGGVNRRTLREILLAGLDDVVRFGKTFERFEQLDGDGGQVRAHFADGTTVTGDLLVAADGANSVLRGQVLPDAGLDDLGSAIYGRTPLTPDIMEWVPEVFVEGFPRVVGPDGISLGMGAYRKRGPFAEATAKFAPGLRLTDTQDFLMWTVSGWSTQAQLPLPLSDAQLRAADAETLHQLASDLVRDWHPTLRRLIQEAAVEATFPVPIRCSRPVERLQTPNVTLLGDAIHTMTPGRGEGANTALRDAALLCRSLAGVASDGMPLAQATEQYETEMLRYGFQAVANSRNPYFANAMKAAGVSGGTVAQTRP